MDALAKGQTEMPATDKPPLFSIVMPVYNAETYIEEAIECVLNQTFGDWELIIVDDASTDDGMHLVNHYAKDESRIKIIRHDENKGASLARNTGLASARGEYIWFLDADDTFDDDLLERLMHEINISHPQIIMFGLVEQYFNEHGDFLYYNEVPLEAARYSAPDEWRGRVIDFERNTNFGYTNSKVYSHGFIKENGLEFQDILLAEDFVYNVEAFRNAESLAIIGGSPYSYRKVEGKSVTNSNNYSAKLYFDLHRMRIEMMRELLIEWDVYDERSRAILGSLFGRYILSAIERMYEEEGIAEMDIAEWLQALFEDDLFNDLIPYAQAGNSKYLKVSLNVLKSKDVKKCVKLGKGINFAKTHFYSFFTKARSGR